MKDKITLRTALTSDMPAIYALVKELAIYEKAEEQLITSIPYYIETFQNKLWNAFVAEHNTNIVATTIFYPVFSTWKGKILYLEDFVVQQDLRRKGIGKILFDHLLKYAQDNDYNGMRWQVLDWNEPAINFYKTYESKMEMDWINCQLIF